MAKWNITRVDSETNAQTEVEQFDDGEDGITSLGQSKTQARVDQLQAADVSAYTSTPVN